MSENKTYLQTTTWGTNTVVAMVYRHFKKEDASEEVVLYCRPNEFVPMAERKIKDGLFQGYKKRTVVAVEETDAEAVVEEPEDEEAGNKKRGNFERDYYISSQGEMYRDERHGSFFEYYESGEVKSDLFYKNGSQEGLQVHFKENGSIDRMMVFQNNKVHTVLTGFVKKTVAAVQKDWDDWKDMDDHSRRILMLQTGALIVRNSDALMLAKPDREEDKILDQIKTATRLQSRYVS